MKVEMKEVLVLTDEEKTMIDEMYSLMLEIAEKSNDRYIYNAVKKISEGIEEFCDMVNITV